MAIGNFLPSMAMVGKGSTAGAMLDLVLRDCALIMESSNLIFSPRPLPYSFLVPFPILGFTFATPDEIIFAKYEYAKYPYLSRAVVANSFIKEVCPLRVRALRPITRSNNVVANYVMNQVLIRKYIERYADRGGLFALNTGWGYIGNLALTEFKGVKIDGSEMGGVGFEFDFERLNFSSLSTASKLVSNALKGFM